MKKKHYPPARVAVPGKARPGWSAYRGLSSSRLGDLVEAALAEQLDWKPLVGALAGKGRQGAFDMEMPGGMWVEVKAVSVFATEYKVKPTRQDVLEKLAWAERHGKPCGTVIVIVTESGKAWVYAREGLGCFRLPADGGAWNFVAKVQI